MRFEPAGGEMQRTTQTPRQVILGVWADNRKNSTGDSW